MGSGSCSGGVIEGFYGRPWSRDQRIRLFGWMQDWGLKTYLYAPKDDPKHRTQWRKPYNREELQSFQELIEAARRRQVDFAFGIGPGLDVEYSRAQDRRVLLNKLDPLLDRGVRGIAFLWDDIVPQLSASDRQRYGSSARAQADFTNACVEQILTRYPDIDFWFCPTPYCGRMCVPNVTQSDYLTELGKHLDAGVQVFWTGPEIVSETIPVRSLVELTAVLGRKPVLWDNLHANDYDLRRIFLGPYGGRDPKLRGHVRSIFLNPNCEFELNYVPLHTLGSFLAARGGWSEDRAWKAALTDWAGCFQVESPFVLKGADISLLADCFYLPHSNGPRSSQWLSDFQFLLTCHGEHWLHDDVRKREQRFRRTTRDVVRLFDHLTRLQNRELLHSLYRHVWDVKEEALLMMRYLDWWKQGPAPGASLISGEHLPGTYRGGLVAALQRCLPRNSKGGFDHRMDGRWETP